MELIIENGYIKGLVIYNKTIEMNVPIENYTFDYSFIVNKMAKTIDTSSITVFVYTAADEASVYNKDGTLLEVVEVDPVEFNSSDFDFENGGVHLSKDTTFAVTVDELTNEDGYAKGSSDKPIITVEAEGTLESNGTITGNITMLFPVTKGDIIHLNASNYSNLRYDLDDKEVTSETNTWPIARSGSFRIKSIGNAKIDYISVGVQEAVNNGKY